MGATKEADLRGRGAQWAVMGEFFSGMPGMLQVAPTKRRWPSACRAMAEEGRSIAENALYHPLLQRSSMIAIKAVRPGQRPGTIDESVFGVHA